jgi:uncharacterized iron-regulated membrane protein
MSFRPPYQPLLLRILHGITATLVLLALISGYWVYNTFDGRWGRLALPRINPIIDIHGTIGLGFFVVAPLLVVYGLSAGRRKLLQPHSLGHLARWGSPAAWVTLQHLSNTAMLGAAGLLWVSGKLMEESWLPQPDN